MMTLALWALAAMHCTLEHVPGFGFLTSCCTADSDCARQQDCGSDGCTFVEKGNYRTEEQTAYAPQPLLVLLVLPFIQETPLPEHRCFSLPASESPPELARRWQFTYRTAFPPRAPSLAS